MITREQLIAKCLENESKSFVDGEFTFRLFKHDEKQEKWHIGAKIGNTKFDLWDHLSDGCWYLDSFWITDKGAQEKFNNYIKLLSYLGIEYSFELPTKEKIVEVEKINVEKERLLEGQIQAYERLLTPFKNLSC